MIDQDILLLSVFPVAMVVIAIWALFLNRRSSTQMAPRGGAVASVADDTRHDLQAIEQRVARLEEEQRRDVRLIAHGRFGAKSRKIRPEARAALSRGVDAPAE